MSDNEEMSEQEFIEFIKKNGYRIKAILEESEDSAENYFKDTAKKAKSRIKEDAEKADDRIGDFFKAVFSPEVQKHMIGAGVEIALGISALVAAIPKSDRAQEFYEKAEEARQNAAAAMCAKNPDCIRRNVSEKRDEIRKIEID